MGTSPLGVSLFDYWIIVSWKVFFLVESKMIVFV